MPCPALWRGVALPPRPPPPLPFRRAALEHFHWLRCLLVPERPQVSSLAVGCRPCCPETHHQPYCNLCEHRDLPALGYPCCASFLRRALQNLVEKIVRAKVYQTQYWKEHCFGLSAEALVDKAVELRCVGGTCGGAQVWIHDRGGWGPVKSWAMGGGGSPAGCGCAPRSGGRGGCSPGP